ncbi:hypothetical protein [Kribbella sp. NBC_00359]|jgi:hypothetical protein|uniref:hypothetical protein n=1 Tax=Kribbella sp. NBC_00359 TaxID=2975966 RepID=UPI002E247BC6
MRIATRAGRVTAQISLLLALVSTSGYMVTRTYLDDPEQVYKDGAITDVVKAGGPVTIDHVEWKLDSLQAYTRLVDDEGEEIDSLGQPAGSVILVATVTLTPLDGLYMKDKGFHCEADLRDDRGNVWQGQQPYGYPLPTYCGDTDHPWTRNKPGKLAQVYVVPASAVPHLTGIQVEFNDENRRFLITP